MEEQHHQLPPFEAIRMRTTIAKLTSAAISQPLTLVYAGIENWPGRLLSLPTPGLAHAHFRMEHTNNAGGSYTVAHVTHWSQAVEL